jgi:hypothetical protein
LTRESIVLTDNSIGWSRERRGLTREIANPADNSAGWTHEGVGLTNETDPLCKPRYCRGACAKRLSKNFGV